jgi:type IV secretory pathway TrbL component
MSKKRKLIIIAVVVVGLVMAYRSGSLNNILEKLGINAPVVVEEATSP